MMPIVRGQALPPAPPKPAKAIDATRDRANPEAGSAIPLARKNGKTGCSTAAAEAAIATAIAFASSVARPPAARCKGPVYFTFFANRAGNLRWTIIGVAPRCDFLTFADALAFWKLVKAGGEGAR